MAAKPKYKTVKTRLWKLVSKYIRTKYSVNGYVTCVTCGITKPFKEMQAGHFIPKARGNAIYFIEENIHPQCVRCNMHLGGNLIPYYRFMQDTYGQEKIDELIELAATTVKFKVADLLDIENEYKQLYDNLEAA